MSFKEKKSIVNSLKSIKHIHYYYYIVSLCLIFLLDFQDIDTIFSDSFAESQYLSKDIGFWCIALFLIYHSLDAKRILSTSANIFDVTFMSCILVALVLVNSENTVFFPTLLLISIWYFSTKQANFPTIFITWLYLLLTLPYPYYNFIVPQLQFLTVNVLEGFIGLIGIPVLVQENSIAIPRGLFIVEEGCSGLKFLSVNLVLLYLYSVLSKFNLRQFLLGLIVTVFISVFINWLRIFIIIISAHNWGFEVPFLVKDHANFGWFVYAVFLFPFFYVFIKIDNLQLNKMSIYKNLSMYPVVDIPPIYLLIPIFGYIIY